MVVVGSILVFLLAGGAAASDVRLVDQIVAKVNGDIITSSELERNLRQLEAELKRSGVSGAQLQKELESRQADILRDRIDNMLLVQRAKDLNISVESEVVKHLADMQVQFKIADVDKFQQWIREQSGMSFEDFRAEMRDNFMTRRVIGQEVASRINIPRAEAMEYYEAHKDEFIRDERVFLSEILLSTEGKSESEIEAVENKAKELVARARAGERFSDLVRDHSESDSADNQGELGAFQRGDRQKEIVDIVFNHQRKEVTDPIRIPTGFLILRIDERHKAGLAAFEEVENEIMEKLYMPRFQPAIRAYLTRLRQEAFLEIRDGFVDSAAAPGKDTTWRDPAQLRPETVTREEVVSRTRRKRLLWLIPIPGTQTTVAPRR